MCQQIIDQGYGFATYPSVPLYDYKKNKKSGKLEFKKVKDLLFGDYIKPEISNGALVTYQVNGKPYFKVHCRNHDGYIPSNKIQADGIVEVNFIDVGQGDGCHIVTEDDNHFIIDAGASDNMFRYIKWRFNLSYSKNVPPEFTGIITHSDGDHYSGFNHLFSKSKGLMQQISFKKILHNGMVETSGDNFNTLGTAIEQNNQSFITDLCDTDQQFQTLVNNAQSPGDYISTLLKTPAPKESVRFKTNLFTGRISSLDVIGPVSQKVNGKDALPVFDKDKGKTKNGNSVILMLTVGKLRILLGGDLNSFAEDYLLQQYSKIGVPGIRKRLVDKNIDEVTRKGLINQMANAIKLSGSTIGADIAKSCHHGSNDLTTEFLKAVNPIATVISSGDNEAYCHPRPDTLGIIGKHSRGESPLIFCTELSRSTREFVNVTSSSLPKERIKAVTVYGMINIRADVDKAIIATKLEDGSGWYIKKIEWDDKLEEFISIP